MKAVAALVVAHRGGAALARTLASVAWTTRRWVVDPAGVLAAADWPPDAERWSGEAGAEWILLLSEGETADEALRAAVLNAGESGAPAWRIALERQAFGGALRGRHRVRLCRTERCRLRVSLGGEIEFATAERPPALAGGAIVHRLPPLPAEAVDALNAEARTLAALAAADGRRPRFGRLLASATAAAGTTLVASGSGRLGWGRWILAVLAGYRALLAEAKLWERAQLGT